MKTIRQIGSIIFVLGLFTTIFAGVPWHVLTTDDPPVPWWLRIAVFCLLGGILIVLISLAIETRKEEPGLGPSVEETGPEMLLVNSPDVPGREVAEVLGVVQGHTIYAIWLGKDLSAIVRLVLGGELTEYTEMMGKARALATQRMIAKARGLGADAVINLRYMTTSVVGSAAELLAYGTAVKLSR